MFTVVLKAQHKKFNILQEERFVGPNGALISYQADTKPAKVYSFLYERPFGQTLLLDIKPERHRLVLILSGTIKVVML